MSVLIAILLFFAYALLISVSAIYLLIRNRRKQRVIGIKLLQALRMFIKHVQVHRGYMMAYLSGERSLSANLSHNIGNISDDIMSINTIDSEFINNSDWQGITSHWARLSTTGKTLRLYQNYNQHCKLVVSSLALMEWITHHYKVFGSFGLSEKIYWYELLVLGEKLGQLRALGMTCLVSRKDQALIDLCLKHINVCLKEIDVIFGDFMLQQKLGEGKCAEINTFIALIEHYIISSKSWITGDQYFLKATEIMESVYNTFDEEMQKLLRV